MKKNASCKGIRTNLLSNANAYRPLSKKPIHLDLLSTKGQSPKVQFPASTKSPPEYALRKKIFSSSKYLLPSNQNINENSNVPFVGVGSPVAQSNKAYDQLKNKIVNLEGRLVQIKKNFELSFHKRNQKSRPGKENIEPLKQKQKSKLVLTKYDDKAERSKHEKSIQEKSKAKESKEQAIKRATVQLKNDKYDKTDKTDKIDNMLQDYVTTFTCQSPTMLTHCASDAKLFKPHKQTSQKKTTQKYYIDAIINAYSTTNPTSFDQLCKTHMTTSIDILQYIKNSNKKPPSVVNAKPLPAASKKPTLIFDLDETLIHCNQNTNMHCDILLPIRFPNGTVVKAGINIRPYAKECLEELAKDYELIVFTASHECYANVIIDEIDKKRLISHRYFRDSCSRSDEGFYVKDLRVIDRDLKNVLLIDNAAYSYSFQLDNGVPIIPFYDNKADLQLKSLVSYIKTLGTQANIRQRNAKMMRLAQYSSMRDAKEVLNKLYGWQN